jgi:hypothetical protein
MSDADFQRKVTRGANKEPGNEALENELARDMRIDDCGTFGSSNLDAQHRASQT